MRNKQGFLLVLSSLVLSLLACEVALRLFTPYGSIPEPPPVPSRSDAPSEASVSEAMRHVSEMPEFPGTDRRWFLDNPEPVPRREVPQAARDRFDDYQRRGLYAPQSDYIWNRRFVEENACSAEGRFRNYPSTVRAFDPPSHSPYPRYRFPPNATTVSGLVTNQFGLRGPQIALAKPPSVIRIAFVGASTTVNQHIFAFSYPEYVVHWLNKFAEANHYRARFEVLNAGREGIIARDTAVIVHDELAPLDPDIVFYYEGANQTENFRWMVWPRIPPRTQLDPGDSISHHRVPELLRTHLALGDLLDRALDGFVAVGEPRKPLYRLVFPRGVDEMNPNVDDPNLPLALPEIVRSLDSTRGTLQPSGGELMLSSFKWLAGEGLTLSPTSHRYIYEQLNIMMWPLRYADIRRVADFQNRVFKAYADSRKILFLDVAGSLPQDPNLFIDAIHMTETGERVKAWVVFQMLAPLVRERILAGRLPRSAAPVPLPPPPRLDSVEMTIECGNP